MQNICCKSRHEICRALLEQSKRDRIRHAVSASSSASVSHCAFAAQWHFTRSDWGSFSSASQRSVLEVLEAAPSVPQIPGYHDSDPQ